MAPLTTLPQLPLPPTPNSWAHPQSPADFPNIISCLPSLAAHPPPPATLASLSFLNRPSDVAFVLDAHSPQNSLSQSWAWWWAPFFFIWSLPSHSLIMLYFSSQHHYHLTFKRTVFVSTSLAVYCLSLPSEHKFPESKTSILFPTEFPIRQSALPKHVLKCLLNESMGGWVLATDVVWEWIMLSVTKF